MFGHFLASLQGPRATRGPLGPADDLFSIIVDQKTTRGVRWSKSARTVKEINAFPFKKDLFLSLSYLFKRVLFLFLVFLGTVTAFFVGFFHFHLPTFLKPF